MRHNKSMQVNQQLRGVNLGGWLILEKWLTESLFAGTDATDEYSFMRTKGARAKITHHRETFITEQDFAWLHDNGFNSVRIPVGYWLFEAQDGYIPTVTYLDWAMKMAEKYQIKVLIDMHGAPGSQNGRDHSGQKGHIGWFTAENQAKTIVILQEIAMRYRDSPALWGIELLNEPATKGRYLTQLRFYRLAYRELRAIVRPGTYTVFHDGFRPVLFTGVLWRRKGYPVAMDVHWYAFSMGNFDRLDRYLRYSAWVRASAVRVLQWWQPVIIGEWSTVLPQNLFDATARFEHNKILAANAAAQQMAYRHAKGWMYWNYTAQGRGMWHFRSLVEDDVIHTSKN
jgi:glucan 1,3-beta-glucosidase